MVPQQIGPPFPSFRVLLVGCCCHRKDGFLAVSDCALEPSFPREELHIFRFCFSFVTPVQSALAGANEDVLPFFSFLCRVADDVLRIGTFFFYRQPGRPFGFLEVILFCLNLERSGSSTLAGSQIAKIAFPAF